MKDSEEEKINVMRLSQEILFKGILFFVALAAFIGTTIVFLYMALYRYDYELVLAVGACDSLIGFVIGQITKSLFRTNE